MSHHRCRHPVQHRFLILAVTHSPFWAFGGLGLALVGGSLVVTWLARWQCQPVPRMLPCKPISPLAVAAWVFHKEGA